MPSTLDWISKTVVDKFAQRFPNELLSVWKDEMSDEPARQGVRYTLIFNAIDDEMEDLLNATAMEVRSEQPDFAWAFATLEGLEEDDWPRVQVWKARPNGEVIGPAISNPRPIGLGGDLVRPVRNADVISADTKALNEVYAKEASHLDPGLARMQAISIDTVNALELAREAFADLDKVADVIADPDLVTRGQRAHISVVMRVPMGAPPVALLQAIDRRRKEFIPDEWEVQVAPELNFPPITYEGDTDEEIVIRIMQIVEPYRLVEAAWFAPAPFKAVNEADRVPRVYVLGEDDYDVTSKLAQMGLKVTVVSAFDKVPRRAKCVFNQVTRLLKAEAEGDAATCKRIRLCIQAAAEAANPAKVARPLDALPQAIRGEPLTHYAHCRWCGAVNPASTNPLHKDACAACGAYQAATMIPLKKEEVPVLALFINPDNSLYLEFVGAPPVPGRLDMSPARRYTIPASACEVFEQNPMGKKEP